jgi:hypothetical protein
MIGLAFMPPMPNTPARSRPLPESRIAGISSLNGRLRAWTVVYVRTQKRCERFSQTALCAWLQQMVAEGRASTARSDPRTVRSP